jgi:hypothetical protein
MKNHALVNRSSRLRMRRRGALPGGEILGLK